MQVKISKMKESEEDRFLVAIDAKAENGKFAFLGYNLTEAEADEKAIEIFGPDIEITR